MRKLILTALLASGVALPALAQDSSGFGARSNDSGAQAANERRSEARAARRAERAARPEGAERERSQVADRANWSARGESRQRAVEQQAAQPPAIQQPQGGELQGWSTRRQDVNRGTGVSQRRWRGGEAGRDPVVQSRAPTGQVVIQHRDGRRDGDRRWDGRRDGTQSRYAGTNRQWSNQWRQDRNYDWRNHRARNRSVFRLGNYYDPYGSRYRRFSIGFSLFPSYYQSNFWLDDPWMYRLPPAYGPYRWVRYYDDALLVNIYTGQVADVIYSFFW